jgi:hypothetical protein
MPRRRYASATSMLLRAADDRAAERNHWMNEIGTLTRRFARDSRRGSSGSAARGSSSRPRPPRDPLRFAETACKRFRSYARASNRARHSREGAGSCSTRASRRRPLRSLADHDRPRFRGQLGQAHQQARQLENVLSPREARRPTTVAEWFESSVSALRFSYRNLGPDDAARFHLPASCVRRQAYGFVPRLAAAEVRRLFSAVDLTQKVIHGCNCLSTNEGDTPCATC